MHPTLRNIKFFLWFLVASLVLSSLFSLLGAQAIEANEDELRFVAAEKEDLSLEERKFWAGLVHVEGIEEGTANLEDFYVCEQIAENTLYDFGEFLDGFKSLKIHDDDSKRRGLSNGQEVLLRCLDDKDEYLNVLLHELGHSVDLLFFDSKTGGISAFYDFGDPIYLNDPSLDFYKLSWINSSETLAQSQEKDFVSRYAMTDPFEDFAESFIFYIRYGEIFRYLIQDPENEVLKMKYDFMKNQVFNGKEFNLDKPLSDKAFLIFGSSRTRVFDVTKLVDLV